MENCAMCEKPDMANQLFSFTIYMPHVDLANPWGQNAD